MKKEDLFKTMLLLSVLCTIFTVSFYFDNQTTDDIVSQYPQQYFHSTSVVYESNYSNYHYNETLELLPPGWLLELYNITVNKSNEV